LYFLADGKLPAALQRCSFTTATPEAFAAISKTDYDPKSKVVKDSGVKAY
jgi:hypothetical protein